MQGTLVGPGVCGLLSSSSLGRATPQNTSSCMKEMYHLTSSLSSKTLFANKQGSPLAGRLFCLAQCWRALVYTTTFSLGTSQMSQHVKIESAGGINFFLQRHSGTGGAWRVASLESNSCFCCGSMKDTLTSLAYLLVSSFPSTADSSSHQSGVLHLSDFHGTHLPKSIMLGSGGVSLPSLSEVSGDSCRKEATVGFSSSGSSKSEPPPSDPSSPCGTSGLVDWLAASLSANLTWQHLLFCPSPLGLRWSSLLDVALERDQARMQWSLSISFSKVEMADSAF